MKKTITIAAALLATLTLTACGSNSSKSKSSSSSSSAKTEKSSSSSTSSSSSSESQSTKGTSLAKFDQIKVGDAKDGKGGTSKTDVVSLLGSDTNSASSSSTSSTTSESGTKASSSSSSSSSVKASSLQWTNPDQSLKGATIKVNFVNDKAIAKSFNNFTTSTAISDANYKKVKVGDSFTTVKTDLGTPVSESENGKGSTSKQTLKYKLGSKQVVLNFKNMKLSDKTQA